MNRFLLCLLLPFVCLAEDKLEAPKEEEPKETKVKEESVIEIKEFIKVNSTPEKEAKWRKAWDLRVQDFLKDAENFDENRFINETVLDWLFDRRSFTVKDFSIQDRLTICRWFLLYMEHDYDPPSKLKEFVCPEFIKKLINLFKNNPPKDD